ncbi:MAG: alpha/beta hydrolase [Phycisphaerae bacterium]
MAKLRAFVLSGLLLNLILLGGCKQKDSQQVKSFDGVKISYAIQGQGEPALVFVHGWSCDKTVWENQIPYFSKNYKVVTIDFGGHGQSGTDRKEWTVEAYGQDVAAVIKKLGIKKAILIGHSMGGSVIAEAALLIPDRVICLVGADTFHDIENGYTQGMDEIIAGLKPDFQMQAKGFARFMFPETADPNLVKQMVEKISSANPAVAINTLENLGKHDLKSTFKNITVPVYSISSDFWPTNFEANKNIVKSFEVKIIPDIGHFVMLEDAAKFNKYLDEIIEEVGSK